MEEGAGLGERRIDGEDVEWDEDLRVTFDGEPFTGEVLIRDADGRPTELTTYDRGFPEGPHRRYYPSGPVEREFVNRGGAPDGEGRQWYESGQPKSLVQFRRGVVQSERRWSEDGQELDPKTSRPPSS